MQPYTYLCAVFLFISYIIGLWFTLRTHAAVIWQAAPTVQAQTNPTNTVVGEAIRGSSRGHEGNSVGDTRSPVSLRDSGLYKRILGQSLDSTGLRNDVGTAGYQGTTLHVVPPRSVGDELLSTSYGSLGESNARQQQASTNIPGFSGDENAHLARGMTGTAAAAATAAVQEVTRHGISRKNTMTRPPPSMPTVEEGIAAGVQDVAGGHDAPNWSKAKSSVVLLGATVLYAIIAEILVDTVDVVLENFDIDEKFLGITLFALVPNTTEFLVFSISPRSNLLTNC